MTRAEKAALAKYPNVKYAPLGFDGNTERFFFIEGYEQAEKDLTEWHDPKEPPTDGREVLLKIRTDEDVRYDVGFYFDGWEWYGAMIHDDDSNVLGWREIHE